MRFSVDLSRREACTLLGLLEYAEQYRLRDGVYLPELRLKLREALSTPVVKDSSGKWWFMDSTWAHSYGPFPTKEMCEIEMKAFNAQ